jgi:hypothetical protein
LAEAEEYFEAVFEAVFAAVFADFVLVVLPPAPPPAPVPAPCANGWEGGGGIGLAGIADSTRLPTVSRRATHLQEREPCESRARAVREP